MNRQMMEIKKSSEFYRPYIILTAFYLLFMVYAFCVDSPKNIFDGLVSIVKSKDLLITDYIELAGFGATLINVSLVGVCSIALMLVLKVAPNGAIIMALWLASGFSFFGKNIVNVWPVMFGVYLFSRVQKRPFADYALVCLLSTSLAPMVSQTAHFEIFKAYNDVPGILMAASVGVFAGFLLPPVASFSVKVHSGYNLYNIGFAAGLLGMVYASFAGALGIDIAPVFIWGTRYDKEVAVFVTVVSLTLIGLGVFFDGRGSLSKLKKITTHSGRLVTDFYMLYGESAYINMGVLGIFVCAVLLAMGADLNGPTLGGIFTIMGFGAFGKHIKNITPIMIGSVLSAILNISGTTSASNTLAILFSTCLAPIAGQFGWGWGVVAGFLHVAMIPSIGGLHAGLNLYNNGFGAGFVALILVPVITAFKKDGEAEL